MEGDVKTGGLVFLADAGLALVDGLDDETEDKAADDDEGYGDEYAQNLAYE